MLYRTQVTDLLKHEKLVTTLAKAKEVRSFADHMITLAKEGTVPARRRAHAFLAEDTVVKKLFSELGPRYANRSGGYTRMTKLGTRGGDAAPLAKIELVS
jgi:large subunit ribosomal protein L17